MAARRHLWVVLLALLIFGQLLVAREIGFTAENRDGVQGIRSIRVAIPFARGEFQNADSFGVFFNGKQLPAVVSVLNRWPQDGSIRWISATFRAPMSGEKLQNFTLNTQVKPLKSVGSTLTVPQLPGKLYFITADGVRYEAAKPDLDQVIESSPERVLRQVEGDFVSKDGKKLCRYLTRSVKTAASPEIKFYFTFLITADEKTAKFQDIGIAFPGKYRVGAIGGVKGDALGKYLLQYEYNKFLVASVKAPREWDEHGDGDSAPGYASADKLRVAVEEFRENFPNELEVRSDALIYHFWPAHGVAKPNREVTDANRQYLWFCHEGKVLDFKAPREYWNVPKNHETRYLREGAIESPLGVAKTAVLRIHPEAGAIAPEAEIIALPAPEQVCASGVLGKNFHPYDVKNFPELENYAYGYLSKLRERAITTPPGDFGKWNYGDSHTAWNPVTHRWSDSYRIWRGYHHASGSIPWLFCLRKGDFDLMRWAIAVTRHLGDIDMCNYSTPESEAPCEAKLNWRRKIKGGLCDYKGLTHWHAGTRVVDYNSQTECMLFYYFITGDVRGLDVAKVWAESTLKHAKKGYASRNGTGVAAAMVDLWLATGDSRYLKMAKLQVDKVLEVQRKGEQPIFELRQEGAMEQWEHYAPGLRKYFEATGDKRVWRAMVALGRAYANGYGDWCSQRDEFIDSLIDAWTESGDDTYLRHAAWHVKSFIAVNPLEKQRGYEFSPTSVEQFFLERLPFYETAVTRYGKPVEPLAIAGSVSEFPYLSNYCKCGDRTVYLLSDGKAFEVRGGFCASSKSLPAYPVCEIISPSGKLVYKKQFTKADFKQIPQPDLNAIGQTEFCYKCGDGEAEVGVYKLTLKPWITRFRLISRLKQAAPIGFHYTPITTGMNWTFKVKSKGELHVAFLAKMKDDATLQLLDENGKVRGEIFFQPARDGKKKVYTFPVEAGLWSLRGRVKTNLVTLDVDGTPIKYVSPSPERHFEPEF